MAPRIGRRRAFAARVCLPAVALVLIVLPGLHALVHVHEVAEAAHEREHVHGEHAHGDHTHDGLIQAHEQPAPSEHEHHGHHHHGGRPAGDDSPLEHGDGAPEHLGVALLESDPPQLAPAGQLVATQAPPAPIDHIQAAARTRAHGSRAPPRDLASLPSM